MFHGSKQKAKDSFETEFLLLNQRAQKKITANIT